MSAGDLLGVIVGTGCSDAMRTNWPAKAGMARDAGAHADAIAQGREDKGTVCVRLWVGALPCSGILHSCWADWRTRPKQAAAPSTGWSWKTSKSAAKSDLMAATLLP